VDAPLTPESALTAVRARKVNEWEYRASSKAEKRDDGYWTAAGYPTPLT
jgi:hypothetical protein